MHIGEIGVGFLSLTLFQFMRTHFCVPFGNRSHMRILASPNSDHCYRTLPIITSIANVGTIIVFIVLFAYPHVFLVFFSVYLSFAVDIWSGEWGVAVCFMGFLSLHIVQPSHSYCLTFINYLFTHISLLRSIALGRCEI